MKNFWKTTTTFLLGVIAGFLILFKLKGPDTVINKNQTVGKIKQKGRDNDLDVELTRSEKSQKRKAVRKNKRLIRKSKKS
jgi:hypothetical protein